jgi:DNA/RNA endonuclease YhcR with UshA esterase domain
MIEKPKLLALVILITFAGIIGIYSYAVLIEAKSVPLNELGPEHLGSLIETQGYIKEVKVWQDRDLQFVLVDYESGKSIDVNVDVEAANSIANQEKMVPGAKIMVNGLVESYKGELLISVSSPEGIKLLQTGSNNVLPLETILSRPEIFEGISVTVRGKVWYIDQIESLEAYSFTLQNSSGSRSYTASCIVFNTTEFSDMDNMRILYGDEVIFTGTIEYYAQRGTWQIQSNEGKDSLIKVD